MPFILSQALMHPPRVLSWKKTHAQNQFPSQACDGHTVQALARRRTICNIRFLGNRNTVAALPTSGHDSQSPPNTQVNSGNRSASLQSKRFHSTRAFCNTMLAASTLPFKHKGVPAKLALGTDIPLRALASLPCWFLYVICQKPTDWLEACVRQAILP